MIKIKILHLLVLVILFTDCDKSSNKHNLSFENAGSLFIGKTIEEVKKDNPGLSIQKSPVNGYKVTNSNRGIFNLYHDTTDNIIANEILSDSICLINICPGNKIDKVKKLFPDLPIMINQFSQKEYFDKSNDKLAVKINVYSNLQGQVVGSYTENSPDKSPTYSFDGYVHSIRVGLIETEI